MNIAEIFKGLEEVKVEKDFSVADGEYVGIVEKLERRTSQKGNPCFSFTVNLIEENKKYFGNLWLTEKSIKFSVSKFKNIIENLTGEQLTYQDFVNEQELVKKLNEKIVGAEVLLKLKTSDKGYQNFSMEKNEMPF
jgi:hypothetical protein|nr:MAG TPA: hypothetical protein [Caudoviricetes sp.]